MTEVQLEMAWRWLCPKCQHANFVRSVSLEPDEGAIRQCLELEPWQEIPPGADADMVTQPTDVECPHCGSEFAVQSDA